MNRKAWDQIVSASAAVIAVAMIVLGGFAIYGGNFGRDNVQTRLEPQNISFPPLDAMSPEEQQEIGDFAGHWFDLDGNRTDEAHWTAQADSWLPTRADRDYVKSLMKPVYAAGQFASWIAASPTLLDAARMMT